jgi:hypothetical protein
MFRQNITVAARRYMSAMSQSVTPMEDALRAKGSFNLGLCSALSLYIAILTFVQITEGLKPTTFQIFNDSHKHSHHQAMQGVTSREVCHSLRT